jgi:hypothetical protein
VEDEAARREMLRELFSHEFLYPDPDRDTEDATLFELYWIFKLLSAYDNPQLRPIDQTTDCVAIWTENGCRYELYHDWTGDDELRFEPSVHDLEPVDKLPGHDRYLSRHGAYLETARAESTAIFGRERPRSPSPRRPDFVLVKRTSRGSDAPITDIALGEVKYSRDVGYLADGIAELLEYTAFARYEPDQVPAERQSPYFADGPSQATTPTLHAFFCIDPMPHSDPTHSEIKILETGDPFPQPF